MTTHTDQPVNDQDYLDRLFDQFVEMIEDGRSVEGLAIEPGREHLRVEVDRLVQLAHGVATSRVLSLPNIPGYTLLGELGRGGMGIVYLAQQERLGRRLVAIKVLLHGALASERQRRRFEREIDVIAGLRHPNIVRVYDSGRTSDGFPYYVMEYVEGQELDNWSSSAVEAPSTSPAEAGVIDRVGRVSAAPVAGGVMAVRTIVEMVAQIGDALAYAHQRGIIHRDLKPRNIRVDPSGQPHLLDFGLAKMMAEGHEAGGVAQMSVTGEFAGSLQWASPEQAEGVPDRIDVRTDVYSLGVLTYRLLTGQFPYPVSGGFREVLENIRSVEPLRPSSLRSDVDGEVDTIVLKCLAKEADRRYQTAGELVRDLHHYLAGEPIEARRDSMTYMLRKQLKRYRATLAVVALLVLVTAAAALVSFSFARQAAGERDEARRQANVANAINQFLLDTLSAPDPFADEHVTTALRNVKVVEALDKAADKVETAFTQEPAVEAGVRATLGTTYLHLGLLDKADPQLAGALQLREALLGPDHRDTLASVGLLAELRLEQGRMEESEALWRRAWEGRRQVLGEHHPDTLTAKDYTALMLSYRMRYDEAERLMRECLSDRRRVLGPEHRDTLHTLNNLGVLLIWRGRYAEAEPLIREVYRCYERNLGPEHFYTASVLVNVATLRLLRGAYDEAAELFRKSYETQLRCSGQEHVNTITAQYKLGEALLRMGRLDEAEPLILQGLESKRRIQGPRHWETLSIQDILADLRYAQGRLAESEEILRRTLTDQEEVLGADHFRTWRSRTMLGRVLVTLDRVREAEPLLTRALRAAREHDRAEHSQTLQTMIELARAFRLEQKYAEVRPLLNQAVEIAARTLEEDHPIAMSAMTEQAWLYLDCGKPGLAAQLFDRVRQVHISRLGAQHPDTLLVEDGLARALLAQGQAEQACPLFRNVYESGRSALPVGHWLLGRFTCDYGRCLIACERYEEAEVRLCEAHRTLVATLGNQHRSTRRAAAELLRLQKAISRTKNDGARRGSALPRPVEKPEGS